MPSSSTRTLRRAGGRAVVTEYSWQTTSCDPCPTPPLEASDLTPWETRDFVGSAPSARLRLGVPAPSCLIARHTVLRQSTQLCAYALAHALRQKTLDADLIFREAEPVVGGRANWEGGLGDQGTGPKGRRVQLPGRYIIRHYWEGAVKCRIRATACGGPPGSGYNPGGAGPVEPAQDLANTARGRFKPPAVITERPAGLWNPHPEALRFCPGETAPR